MCTVINWLFKEILNRFYSNLFDREFNSRMFELTTDVRLLLYKTITFVALVFSRC